MRINLLLYYYIIIRISEFFYTLTNKYKNAIILKKKWLKMKNYKMTEMPNGAIRVELDPLSDERKELLKLYKEICVQLLFLYLLLYQNICSHYNHMRIF